MNSIDSLSNEKEEERRCKHCSDIMQDSALERRLDCLMPVCSNCYVSAIMSLQVEWELRVERLVGGSQEDKDKLRAEGLLPERGYLEKLNYIQFKN